MSTSTSYFLAYRGSDVHNADVTFDESDPQWEEESMLLGKINQFIYKHPVCLIVCVDILDVAKNFDGVHNIQNLRDRLRQLIGPDPVDFLLDIAYMDGDEFELGSRNYEKAETIEILIRLIRFLQFSGKKYVICKSSEYVVKIK